MRNHIRKVVAFFLILPLLGCAPGAQVGQSPAQSSEPRAPRTLVMVARVEPTAATARVSNQSGAIAHAIIDRLFSAGLAFYDEREIPRPYLAESLPQLNTDSWKVFPDGRMETTYRLKPNLTWHDGTALSAQDFVFALQVYSHPDVTALFDPNPQSVIEEVVAPDDRTVMIRWRQLYFEAGALDNGKMGFLPLPRHILAQPMQTDPASVANHPYWAQEFVGLGPYRLERWEAGSFIEGAAFDGHVLGRPLIDRVRLVAVADPNAAVVNLLSGTAQLAADNALEFQQAGILQREWAANSGGTILLNSKQVRYVQLQFRPEVVSPKAMLDLRVRKALAQATDRQALVDGMLDGQGIAADTMVSPDTEYFPTLDGVLTKYPYDPRRVEQLLTDAGLAKRADGFFAGGESFAPEVRGPTENDLSILIEGWRRAGVDAHFVVAPPSLAANNEYRAGFPAGFVTVRNLPERTAISTFESSGIAAPENRFAGTNKGGYSNPEYDRLATLFGNTLERSQRNDQVVQLMKLASEEVPGIPLYYDVLVTAHSADLEGPLRSAPAGLFYWNIHEWRWK
jgi:peptide/nickel transport system substrate-binding protein